MLVHKGLKLQFAPTDFKTSPIRRSNEVGADLKFFSADSGIRTKYQFGPKVKKTEPSAKEHHD